MQSSRQPRPEPGAPMFVHDFAIVHMPVNEAVAIFAAKVNSVALAPLVLNAWEADAGLLAATGLADRATIVATSVQVEINLRRSRSDATIVNIKWRGNGWLPTLDADLELVAFGPQRTHLHLMGRYDLPASVERYSNTGSLIQRVMVVAVRTFLQDLGDLLIEPAA